MAYAGSQVLIRTYNSVDYAILEVDGVFPDTGTNDIEIDLSRFDIDINYKFSGSAYPFKLIEQAKDTGAWSNDMIASYGNQCYSFNATTNILTLNYTYTNLNNTKSNYKLYFRGKAKGSVIIKGHSYNLNKEHAQLTVTTFGDTSERSIQGIKKVELTIEAYEIQDFLLDSITNGTPVSLEILPTANSIVKETFTGFVSKVSEKTEVTGVRSVTFDFKSV